MENNKNSKAYIQLAIGAAYPDKVTWATLVRHLCTEHKLMTQAHLGELITEGIKQKIIAVDGNRYTYTDEFAKQGKFTAEDGYKPGPGDIDERIDHMIKINPL